LASALAVLDGDHKKDKPSDIEQIKQALRVLRFLGSEASTRELARRFWSYDRRRQVHPISAEYPINYSSMVMSAVKITGTSRLG
jgi:hypothetical protein